MQRRTIYMLPLAALIAACTAPQSGREISQDPVAVHRIDGTANSKTETEPMTSSHLMQWSDLTDRPLPHPSQTINTGPGPTDLVDVWLPDTDGPYPTVLMIHGGCWQKAIADRTLMNYSAEALRREGIAVWNIEYRGVDEAGGGYPGTYEDVSRGVDALGRLGPALGLQTDRVVAFGHSAGGHLALWAAARQNLPESSPLHSETPLGIFGVVNAGGLADLEASAPVTQPGCLSDIMGKLTGAPSEARKNVFADTSPSELLPMGVWQVSVNGAQDPIAPPRLGEAYTMKARDSGDRARFETIDASGHVELISPGSNAFSRETQILKEMLGTTKDEQTGLE